MENRQKKDSLLDKWKNREGNTISSNRISKAPIGEKIPLSHGQRRLWFLQQMYPKNPFYNYSETYTLNGTLSEESLLKSLKKIYDKNDILRSTYHIDNGEVYQKINDSNLDISIYDLSKKADKLIEEEANSIIEKGATHYFDLTEHPLIRCSLIKKSAFESVLLICMHHIVVDEWSMKLFRKQLCENYNQFNNNDLTFKHTSKTDDIEYTDYAYWQSKNSTHKKEHLLYWKNKLSGEIPRLDLPTDYPRPPRSNFKGLFSKTSLYDKTTSNKIIAAAEAFNTTPYVIMLSVYFTFLHWYSGQNDILVGSPVTNRDQKSLENIIGFFLDTLVIRTDINPLMTFKELVALVRENTFGAFANKNVPFDVLVKELGADRSLSVNPFFQVMFVYNEEVETLKFNEDLTLTHEFFDTKVSKFDLTIFITKHKDSFSSKFEFSTQLFKASTIDNFHEHFNVLLEELLNNPDQKLSHTSVLTQSEKLLFSNKSLNTYSFEGLNGVHSLIESNVEKTPNAIAVSFNENTLTYKELNDKSNYLAQSIINLVENTNTIIGLCIDRSPNMIVGILGILKAGCCYMPVDPEYPQERIDFILKDSNSKMIVCDSKNTSLFDSRNFSILNIDTLDTHNKLKLNLPKVSINDLAYLIYTSGSTGKPKGVPITHKNIINSTLGRFEFYKEAPKVFLLMSSISFDSSKAGIFWTLCKGGNLIITEKRIEQDIEKIGYLIQNHNVTHTLMLPSLYNLILDYVDPFKIKSLHTVIVAGEACSKELCKTHFKHSPKVNLYNEYGPTEASVWCTAHKITSEDCSNEIIPIGKPVANSMIYILNKDLKHLPLGAVGEIYIGGINLSSGYINRENLTKKVFIPNPYAPEEKLYNTGDLGRYDNNGNLIFLGRGDQQIKIRGYRIELREIENTINQYSKDIDNSIVLIEEPSNHSELENDIFKDDDSFFKILKSLSNEELNEVFPK
ncbi:non-ribosomal peptide synthetase [Seonamhaeicola marinus]|uniref:Amino acid adenylation domain-containing protein n=1 Tax=Seonamhaeicola marinus TaxID=1912246 RepID=A0A5D0HTN0_9FLAO|nr:amino acid adenylation domain-containing protein [Seonamhaeicola marinus]TYA74714.1 amino acid adenylation domain-containing protein [Seonamhaeicola marinus]